MTNNISKINILDKSVYTKIAAGEVVEKPSSIIKECVENSIDAKAKNIVIEIVQGGIAKIRISDDGLGIYFSDMEKAFLPHATSKIYSADDLGKIGTLGFRGEALSSIGAVSKVTLVSKTNDSEVGAELKVCGGEMGNVAEKGCPNGTTITIEDLFYCIPARAKFLRKPKLEESDCTNIVLRLILANPNIGIKYIADGKTIYHSNGTGLKDAIFAVYGKETVDNLVDIDYENNIDGISVKGYVTRPTFIKANRTYQTLIINGRYVQNFVIANAILRAFEPYMMKNGFPMFVLNMTLPLDKVDVNVHPSKLEVKFEDSNKIYGLFNNLITEVLFNLNHIKDMSKVDEEIEVTPSVDLSRLSVVSGGIDFKSKVNSIDTMQAKDLNQSKSESIAEKINKFSTMQSVPQETAKYTIPSEVKQAILNDNTASMPSRVATPSMLESIIDDYDKKAQGQVNTENNKQNYEQNAFSTNIRDYKVVGVLFDTFIILEQGENMLMIDQHAGHERLLYDKFKKAFSNSELNITDLLVPYILNLNHIESEYIRDNIDKFAEIGIKIEEFGTNSFKVASVPVLLKDIDFGEFFFDVLKDMNTLNIKKTDMLEHYLATSACKAAVKAHDILTPSEIDSLLDLLSDPKVVLLCPHGRPVVIKYNKKDIEKWFKRIV